MSTKGLEILDHNVQLTHAWINELDVMLGWNDRTRTFRLLRVTLQTLRDVLPLGETADFAAQLPTLLRGVFYEHWRPAAPKISHRDRDYFFTRINGAFRTDPFDDVGDAVSIVFAFLSRKISAGEIGEMRQSMPEELRSLWPQ